MRMLIRISGVALAVGLFWMAAASFLVVRAARGRIYSATVDIPTRRVGLVLGCSRFLSDGRRNSFFDNRIHAAAELINSGKVRYLVVSGDNHKDGYDEPGKLPLYRRSFTMSVRFSSRANSV
jgi:SanA protein